MKRNEKLTFISDAGTVEFSSRSAYWWNSEEGMAGLENNIYTSKGSGQDGENFIGSNLPARPITIEGQIRTNTTVNRRRLISLLNPKNVGRLVYGDGTITRYVPCYVKKAPSFGRGIFPNFQIEFYCPSPFWREGNGDTPNLVDIALWEGKIEFPIEIPVEGMELEIRSPSLIVNVPNDGDVDAGITVVLRATAATSNPSLVNVETQETLSLTIDMLANDEIRVKTGYGEKSAVLIRNGVTTNIFNTIDAGSTWLQIHPGDNLIRYDATVTDNLLVSIYYEHYYLGV